MSKEKVKLSEGKIMACSVVVFFATAVFLYAKIAPWLWINREWTLGHAGETGEIIMYMFLFPFLFIAISWLVGVIVYDILVSVFYKTTYFNKDQLKIDMMDAFRNEDDFVIIERNIKELLSEYKPKKNKNKINSYTFNK